MDPEYIGSKAIPKLSELLPELPPELLPVPELAPLDELDPAPEPLPEEDEPEPLPEEEEVLSVPPPSDGPAPPFELEQAGNAAIATARTAITQDFLPTIPTDPRVYERRPSTTSAASAEPSSSRAARRRSGTATTAGYVRRMRTTIGALLFLGIAACGGESTEEMTSSPTCAQLSAVPDASCPTVGLSCGEYANNTNGICACSDAG
jgi:hypothetical protein